ncbi:branched-chain-amino-acid aminotransferase-like protein 2, partial [Trifolium medium]|nr:branched-chain-amino-acid aminotransferase-like protein 2 [Trifolium medium]
MEVIHSWSAPRSLSTSLMYSFSQRDDIEVLDEPLYANFLRVTGLDRPYKDQLLSKMTDIIYGPGNSKYRFCKHMSKQRVLGLPENLTDLLSNCVLQQSFDKFVPPSFIELGLWDLVLIYNDLCGIGKPPPVIDAAELQKDPE